MTESYIFEMFKEDRSECTILAVYFDDMVIAGLFSRPSQRSSMEVMRDRSFFMSQSLYIQDVLGRFKTHPPGPSKKLNGAETPMDHRIRLNKNGSTRMRLKPKDKNVENLEEKCGSDIPCKEVVWGHHYGESMKRDRISHLLSIKYCCDPLSGYNVTCLKHSTLKSRRT